MKKGLLIILCIFCSILTACGSLAPPQSESNVRSATELTFNYESGFYDDDIALTISCPITDAKIYYTTDGSIPDEQDMLYTEPISLSNISMQRNKMSAHRKIAPGNQYVPANPVKKGNIIRAIAYFPDNTTSAVATGTFFIGIDQEKQYPNVPVISLVTEEQNLFDHEKGIYVMGQTYEDWIKEDPAHKDAQSWEVIGNFSNRGKDWERPVHFTYIDATGKTCVSTDMGLRIKGATTRTYYQKSLRLIARSEYGEKTIHYPLIPDNMKSDGSGPVENYKSFVLRNGGNACDFGKIRDPFLQEMISERGLETQQSTPCVVFLDGEYWGLYTLTEDYSDDYLEENYGIDKKNVVMVKCGTLEEGEDADFSLFESLYQFITEHDMREKANYEEVKKMLDLPGFIDYCAFQLYIDNHDSLFQNNNWSLWRVRTPDSSASKADGKWRMLIYDTEFSTGVYTGGQDFETDNISPVFDSSAEDRAQNLAEYHPVELFRSLYQNEEFKKDLVLSLCDIRNYYFEKDKAFALSTQFSIQYSPLAKENILRNGPDWVAFWQDPDEYFHSKQSELKCFLGGRYMQFPKIMKYAFDLGDYCKVSLTVSDTTKGTIQINRTPLDFESLSQQTFTGTYFPKYEITLKAISQNGHHFIGWEYNGCQISDPEKDTVTVTLSQDCEIKALFD